MRSNDHKITATAHRAPLLASSEAGMETVTDHRDGPRDECGVFGIFAPDHDVARGKLCGKCALAYNGVWLDERARLTRPMKRIGPKGTRQFAPVSWDEALRTISVRLQEIIGRGQAALPDLLFYLIRSCSSLTERY